MKYSKLKNKLELLELNQKHELMSLKLKHQQATQELLSGCTHKYEDGSSTSEGNGNQWDMSYRCAICGKRL